MEGCSTYNAPKKKFVLLPKGVFTGHLIIYNFNKFFNRVFWVKITLFHFLTDFVVHYFFFFLMIGGIFLNLKTKPHSRDEQERRHVNSREILIFIIVWQPQTLGIIITNEE